MCVPAKAAKTLGPNRLTLSQAPIMLMHGHETSSQAQIEFLKFINN